MKLYFSNASDERELVAEDIVTTDDAVNLLLEDLKKRKPNFISHYQRCWFDDEDNIWIDYGSHVEFYVLEGYMEGAIDYEIRSR